MNLPMTNKPTNQQTSWTKPTNQQTNNCWSHSCQWTTPSGWSVNPIPSVQAVHPSPRTRNRNGNTGLATRSVGSSAASVLARKALVHWEAEDGWRFPSQCWGKWSQMAEAEDGRINRRLTKIMIYSRISQMWGFKDHWNAIGILISNTKWPDTSYQVQIWRNPPNLRCKHLQTIPTWFLNPRHFP